MRPFDSHLWKEKAEERQRRSKTKLGKDEAEERYKRDIKAINSLRVVVEWCQARALTVDFSGSGGTFDPETKEICVSARALPDNQLYMLLHEVGHYLIDVCGSSRSKTSKGYTTNETDKSIHYKVDLIDEEYDAWERGRKLALRLNLKIDEKRFNDYKVRSIKTYFHWAVDKDNTYDIDE